ncbi:heavy metal sensor histidine kinase [Trinickia terrae]|uniref:Sensor protein n=1 Tax=Trinickia terrae TaxID=2571161 RepID=A0A4U1HX55_9BURK|nr:heavy metal sensor histidine kinase [Trinickia terrae]TKC86242.1 heavy metal sensor histidine kinase [Trinickia terrae]
MNRSIARRLAMMFALVALFVFALVGTALFLVLRTQLEHHLRESLDDRREIAQLIVTHSVTPEKWKMAREKLTDMTPRDRSTQYSVASSDPRFQYGHPVTGTVLADWGLGYQKMRPDGGAADMLVNTMTIPASGARPEVQLQVAASCAPNTRTLRAFGVALAALCALGTLAVLLLSHSVAKLGLAPLARLTRDAQAVSPNNRSQRLDARSLPLELNDLANAFNGALERLDVAYGRLESFNADVAHELRTPVTILIGQTEVALTARNRSIEDLRHTLQSNLEEFERMRGIINDMLFLARADQGERATGLVEVSLAAEVGRTLDYLEIPFDEAQVRAVSHGDARAPVNTSLFGRACTNLLMNALQHCSRDMTATVTIARYGEHVRISVANPGKPIDPAALGHLFDRFYRVEASRTNSRENHGLGLAIVKAVAEMHGGTVFASSANGVNTFGFSVAAGPDAPREPGRDKSGKRETAAQPRAAAELAAAASAGARAAGR